MNTQYFANQRLSEKLEKLGCESQFDFWWCYNTSNEWEKDNNVCDSFPYCLPKKRKHLKEENKDADTVRSTHEHGEGTKTFYQFIKEATQEEKAKIPLILLESGGTGWIANFSYHVQQSYHFSDLLLDENILKITNSENTDRASGEYHKIIHGFQNKIIHRLPNHIDPRAIDRTKQDWQSFVEQEVDKRLSERV